MKKIITLISIILITFISFIIISNTPRNYETKYTINKIEVNEQYNKNKQLYLFTIKDKKLEIPYQIIHKYTKKRKLITTIKNEDDCYTINVFNSSYKLCYDENVLKVDNKIKNETPINSENNIEIYKSTEEIFIWNYKGYYKLENNKLTNIKLFKNDNYENKISFVNEDYLITANYDEKYEFNKFYLINKKNNNVKELTTEKPISANSYFLGTYANKVYLLDPKYKYEYEIIPKKKKITIINKNGSGIYYEDNEKANVSINKLVKEKMTFPIKNLYDYSIKNNKLILTINGKDIIISNEKIDEIIKISNESVYYLIDGTLYKYTFGRQKQKVISNTEWKFNTANQIFIFN